MSEGNGSGASSRGRWKRPLWAVAFGTAVFGAAVGVPYFVAQADERPLKLWPNLDEIPAELRGVVASAGVPREPTAETEPAALPILAPTAPAVSAAVPPEERSPIVPVVPAAVPPLEAAPPTVPVVPAAVPPTEPAVPQAVIPAAARVPAPAAPAIPAPPVTRPAPLVLPNVPQFVNPAYAARPNFELPPISLGPDGNIVSGNSEAPAPVRSSAPVTPRPAVPVPQRNVAVPPPPAPAQPERVVPTKFAQPVVAAQPKDPAPAPVPNVPAPNPNPLPNPRPLPFGDDKVRLPLLGNPPVLGATPVPTEKDLEEYRQFIEGVIDPKNTFDLIVGRARLVNMKATPTRTQIADPSIASFRLIEPKGEQMTIIGSRPGTTVLNLWFTDPNNKDKEKVLSYLVRVLPDPEAKERLEAVYKVLEGEINRAYPQSRVRLTLVGDKLMVSGQAHDVAEATQILRIARANAPQTGNRQTDGQRPPISTAGATAQPSDPLRPDPTPGLTAFQTEGGPNVINNLRVPGEQQVMLRVVVAEVNRAAARSIGLNFSLINNRGVQVFAQQTGGLGSGAVGAAVGGAVGGAVNLPVNLDNGQIPIAINALRTLNYARSLAEPNLTTLNGRPATFQAGGQFPVPVIGGVGNLGGVGGAIGGGLQGVQFVPFGVQLSFLPIITDRDRVRLTLNATVSTRDNSASTNIGGANVPGLNTRTFSTTIELREGQTMAVAGLIQNNIGASAARVPLFGDLPFIGRLASVHQTSAGEQELIVLVTPELVHPLEPHELGPIPGSDVFEPGDMEFYLAGRLESRRMHDYRSPVMTELHRMLRYRRCEQIYITGPSGHVDPPEPTAVVVPAGGIKK